MMIHMLRLSPQNDTNNINAFNKSKRVMIEIFFSKRGKQKFQTKISNEGDNPDTYRSWKAYEVIEVEYQLGICVSFDRSSNWANEVNLKGNNAYTEDTQAIYYWHGALERPNVIVKIFTNLLCCLPMLSLTLSTVDS